MDDNVLTLGLVGCFVIYLLGSMWINSKRPSEDPYPMIPRRDAEWTYKEWYGPDMAIYKVRIGETVLAPEKQHLDLLELWTMFGIPHGTPVKVRSTDPAKKDRILAHPDDIVALEAGKTLELYL